MILPFIFVWTRDSHDLLRAHANSMGYLMPSVHYEAVPCATSADSLSENEDDCGLPMSLAAVVTDGSVVDLPRSSLPLRGKYGGLEVECSTVAFWGGTGSRLFVEDPVFSDEIADLDRFSDPLNAPDDLRVHLEYELKRMEAERLELLHKEVELKHSKDSAQREDAISRQKHLPAVKKEWHLASIRIKNTKR